MSSHKYDSRATPPTGSAERSVKGAGSYNSYSSNKVCGDFKSAENVPTRAAAVGLRGSRNTKHTTAEKIAARTIKRPNGCWEVQGAALHSGHVQVCESDGSPRGYHFVRVHVWAWEQANGRRVPKGLVCMHACDNPRCINPDHLSVGTQRDNILDSIRKGRYNAFGHQKLNAEQVIEIRKLADTTRLTQKEIGRRFGIAKNTVSQIIARKTWAHLPPFAVAASHVEPVASVAGATLQVIDAGTQRNQELHHLPEQGRRPEVIRHV